jgi:hypothetical protein
MSMTAGELPGKKIQFNPSVFLNTQLDKISNMASQAKMQR